MKIKTIGKFATRVVLNLLMLYLLIAAFLFVTQELFIFPLLVVQLKNSFSDVQVDVTPPKGVEEFFAKTVDGEKIDVWTTYDPSQKPKYVAMIFHGNGETVSAQNFLPFFKKMKIPAFSFDYRGYGLSSGWPSEQGLYNDGEAVWSEIQKRTGLDASHLIILGNSIGSGPSSFLANKISPKALILLAAYSDFPSLVSGMPLYSPFKFILSYKLPVKNYLQTLNTDCLIMAHGKLDEVIPFKHLGINISNVNPKITPKILESDIAKHGDIFYKVETRLRDSILECLKEAPVEPNTPEVASS